MERGDIPRRGAGSGGAESFNWDYGTFDGNIVATLLQKTFDLIHVFAKGADSYTNEGQPVGKKIVGHIRNCAICSSMQDLDAFHRFSLHMRKSEAPFCLLMEVVIFAMTRNSKQVICSLS